MKEKKTLATFLIIIGGILIIIWGLLHVFIMLEIQSQLNNANVEGDIISLITLSYLGIIIMISINGLIVIFVAYYGIKMGAKWAFYIEISQGVLFAIVTILLISLQPKVTLLNFSSEFILLLAIATDLFIAILILLPLILWHNEFF
ncbi:MAG: hypothetical protein ACTSQJ_07800 [Promethearchaeota archaeon]